MMPSCLGPPLGPSRAAPPVTPRRPPLRAARATDVPPATRATRPGGATRGSGSGWSLVTGSVVAGRAHPGRGRRHDGRVGRLGDLVAGQTLTDDDLRPPGCASTTSPTRPLPRASTSELPDALTLARPLSAGELVPAARWASRRPTTPCRSPSRSPPSTSPPTWSAGSRVDVWVVADGPSRSVAAARPPSSCSATSRSSTPRSCPTPFASATSRQLVLAVPEADEERSARGPRRRRRRPGPRRRQGLIGVICVLLLAAGEAWESPCPADLEAAPGTSSSSSAASTSTTCSRPSPAARPTSPSSPSTPQASTRRASPTCAAMPCARSP